jgi:hypothetical protein
MTFRRIYGPEKEALGVLAMEIELLQPATAGEIIDPPPRRMARASRRAIVSSGTHPSWPCGALGGGCVIALVSDVTVPFSRTWSAPR